MLRRERMLLYPIVLVLAVFLVMDRIGATESLLPGANATEARNGDDIPATAPAASSPYTTDTEQTDRLITVHEERLVWGDGPRQRTYTMGFVDLAPLMTPLLESPAREAARNALRAELTREEERLRTYIEHLAEQAGRFEPTSQEYRTLYDEYIQLAEAYESFEQDAMTRTGKLDAEQLEEVYRLVLDAVNTVAEREGIDLVQRRTDPAAPFDAEGPQAAMTAIRLRDTLRVPLGLDITPLVLEELTLPAQ